MSAAEVVVLRTGTANVASVLAGLQRAGAAAELGDGAAAVGAARRLVLPGVGSLAASMAALAAPGVGDALRQRVAAGRDATLGICMGLQLLCQGSEESPEVAGVGAVRGVCRRFTGAVKVPHLGWNEVRPRPGCALLQPGYAYFAHSFALPEVPTGWHGAVSEHGGPFVAALERGPMLLCQFHPELSGDYGQALLRRWLGAA